MIPFDLQCQKWDPAGSGDSYSVQNAMGKSHLNIWDILLREALQNSLDARVDQTIDFSITDQLLSREQTHILTETVFSKLPPEGASKKLSETLEDGRMRVLCISDLGTRGLGGPLRADIAAAEGERSDFADFVRNFGRSQSKGLEGGTYGYGKGVLYSASQVGLCIIYSNTLIDGCIETRLIGVSGGDPDYSYEGLRFTGKNWWGRAALDGVVDPLTGWEAREIASKLGIPHDGAGSTGTTIVIISPKTAGEDFDSISPEERMKILREAALTWAWPLAINSDDPSKLKVRFNFRVNGSSLRPLVPEQDPRFRDLAKAMKIAERWVENPHEVPEGLGIFKAIASERPKQLLGYLVSVPSDPATTTKFQNTVALMRAPRIVVRYLPVPLPPADIALSSIFVANEEVEDAFARAEPVTHDDWVASSVKNESRINFVRIALRKIKAVFSDLSTASASASTSSHARGTAGISTSLGQLLGSFSGTDAGGQPSPGGGGGGEGPRPNSRKPTVRLLEPPRLFEMDGKPHVAFKHQIIGGRAGMRVEVIPNARVVVDGGSIERTENRPIAGQNPEFVGWQEADGVCLPQKRIIDLPTNQELVAVYTQPFGTAIRSLLELKDSGV